MICVLLSPLFLRKLYVLLWKRFREITFNYALETKKKSHNIGMNEKDDFAQERHI